MMKILKIEHTMYIVNGSKSTFLATTLDEAMNTAKVMNEFVTITGQDFEIVGMFGVDTVKDGICPDGIEYDWDKSSRIGRMSRSKLQSKDDDEA